MMARHLITGREHRLRNAGDGFEHSFSKKGRPKATQPVSEKAARRRHHGSVERPPRASQRLIIRANLGMLAQQPVDSCKHLAQARV